ncbi:Formate/nitrite transporter [Teratosphaeria destructans]|uniref:Formate/nitrite transporter n=1 Tax=Teratosphaeria destructans TaxID=418781 RepID=A0A9W7W5M4_9PEZI|nr:Formate/nitrite transporter [Teratosphaeria destructans]
MATSGALSPIDTAYQTLETGTHHLFESTELAFLKNILGGFLISAGNLLAISLAGGFPTLSEHNPGFTRLIQGLLFPIGLIIVYSLGGELYTGYPMWLAMTALERKGRPMQYVRAILSSLLGNFVGVIVWDAGLTYASQTFTDEPWRSQLIEKVDGDITHQPWYVVFLRAIGCGFLVTVSMLLGTQNRDGISKALGLHLPFFISIAAAFPHTVEYMSLGVLAMLNGAEMTVPLFLWKCQLPLILGNAVGGAFTGVYQWWVYIQRGDDTDRTEGRREWLTDGDGELRS